LKNNDKYQILINDRQFKETLKKEWQKGNISDDRIITLAQNAGADYLCFTKIKSVKGLKGKQVTASVYDLATMSYTDQMGMETIEGDFSNLKHLTEVILDVVDDMLGTSSKSSNVSSYGKTFKDSRDGKQYKIVKIGTQTWMAENLNYNASGSKCYNNDPAYCQKYGRLYDWETAKSACPNGWHLPSKAEWEVLRTLVGGKETAGKYLKSASGWSNFQVESGNGTDAYGFSALPGGCGYSNGSCGLIGFSGTWWSSSEYSASNAYHITMFYEGNGLYINKGDKSLLFSVRCLKD